MQKGSVFLLMSRAAVVDFPAMLAAVRVRVTSARRSTCFPTSRWPPTIRCASMEGLLLSAHRTGGTPDALFAIGEMAVADAELIMKGLPPQLCRRADPATAARLRSKPVSVT